MDKLLWEVKTLLCDICKERPLIRTKFINGKWQGICTECENKNEMKDEV